MGDWGCREVYNPTAIVIKKKGWGGGRVNGGSQINRTKHSHFSHHISSEPPLRETVSINAISINWGVLGFEGFPVLANQVPGSYSGGVCQCWWGVCQPYGNVTEQSQTTILSSFHIISKGHIYIKTQRNGHLGLTNLLTGA